MDGRPVSVVRRVRWVPLLLTCASGIAGPAVAGPELFLHKSAVPVVVPGGSTLFPLDQAAPTASAVTVEALSVPKGNTEVFPTFTGTAFGASTPVDPVGVATLHLSSNQPVPGCADLQVDLLHVDAIGATSLLGSTSCQPVLPQGAQGGSAGFLAVPVVVPVGSGNTIGIGESIAVTITVDNACNVNRVVSLVYDATGAPSSVRFQTAVPAQELLLSGKTAIIKENNDGGITKLIVKDPSVVVTGCQNDPRLLGASLRMVNPLSGEEATLPMPASNWRVTGRGFKFENLDAPGGPSPVKTAVLKNGKLLKVAAKIAGITLDEATQGAMEFVFTLGTDRYCASFDQPKRDVPGVFIAKNSLAPTACASPSGAFLDDLEPH